MILTNDMKMYKLKFYTVFEWQIFTICATNVEIMFTQSM